MDVFKPGDHGSTFGGNPLAASVGLTALTILIEDNLIQNAQIMGNYLMESLKNMQSPFITALRGKGLFIGAEVDPEKMSARELCLRLLEAGILSKETHGTVIRFAPPLIIDREGMDEAIDRIRSVFCKSQA